MEPFNAQPREFVIRPLSPSTRRNPLSSWDRSYWSRECSIDFWTRETAMIHGWYNVQMFHETWRRKSQNMARYDDWIWLMCVLASKWWLIVCQTLIWMSFPQARESFMKIIISTFDGLLNAVRCKPNPLSITVSFFVFSEIRFSDYFQFSFRLFDIFVSEFLEFHLIEPDPASSCIYGLVGCLQKSVTKASWTCEAGGRRHLQEQDR